METYYKQDEIAEHFQDYLAENPLEKDVEPSDLHHEVFNLDYYIIGTYQAKKWLGDHAFEVINIIKDYEQDNFGEVNTDFSDPEKVVNMYTYIVGEQVIYDWHLGLEERNQ